MKTYIQRDLSALLCRAIKSFPAVLVTGPRQSGKTTFLRNELGHSHAYVSFDDPMQRQFALSDPNGFLNQFLDKPVILDEVQYVPQLFSYIKIRIDDKRGHAGRWIMTGSQQFELMKNVSDSLAGRIAILELLPFSCREIHKEGSKKIANAVWTGGYPAVVIDSAQRDQWIKSYIQTYVERDVRQLQNIRDLHLFETFVGLYAASHAQVINHASISRDCGISQPACKSWENILEASYIIRLLPPYYNNFGKRLIKNPKLYFVDSALVAWLTRQPDAASMMAGSMGGAFFEGWVVMEAFKIFASSGKRPDIYYWRSHDGQEVDLLLEIGGKLHPVEIKKTATPMPHHCEALSKFKSLIKDKCGESLVVCCVDKPTIMPGGITALPWHAFSDWIAERL